MAVVSQVVNLLDDKFQLVTLMPGDEVPEWATSRITNPAVLATVPPIVPDEPQSVTEVVAHPDAKDAYAGLNKAELVALAKDRDLDTSGNKPDIIARLKEADKAADDDADVDVFSLSVDELKALAERHGIDIGEATTDVEIATIIQQAKE
ncbi:SAP domain-containing protein [Leucobacter allii]|uniref:SAP domain-containing protein n=1 Tax=Leucobacter allii TaxID=2932247 RepID=UPI001FD0F030|nr:SAP domain-containing protein [Leucobacter allii]UOR02066.1 SAP domain-containing protein [Leucobacter allii]